MTLTEVLPPQKSSPRNAVRYNPATGRLEVDTRRATTAYRVVEFPSTFGRAFTLRKLDKGTDSEASRYEVLCGESGEPDRCDCRGHTRWGSPCRHLLAVRALIENRWI